MLTLKCRRRRVRTSTAQVKWCLNTVRMQKSEKTTVRAAHKSRACKGSDNYYIFSKLQIIDDDFLINIVGISFFILYSFNKDIKP